MEDTVGDTDLLGRAIPHANCGRARRLLSCARSGYPHGDLSRIVLDEVTGRLALSYVHSGPLSRNAQGFGVEILPSVPAEARPTSTTA